MKITLFLTALVFMSGCSSARIVPETDPAKAEYGKAPADYEKQIREYWKATLKDPDSLKVNAMGKPVKAMAYGVETSNHFYDNYSDVTFTPIYGYRVCANYNAKNSYGGYSGASDAVFFFDAAGKFSAPRVLTKDMMEGMHQKGSFVSGSNVTTDNCK